MRRSGEATPYVYAAVLLLRAAAKGDSQDVEGRISEIQQLCKRCPNIHLPRVTARTVIRHSDATTVADCVEVHQHVVEFEKSEAAFARFAPITTTELKNVPCEFSEVKVDPGISLLKVHNVVCFIIIICHATVSFFII